MVFLFDGTEVHGKKGMVGVINDKIQYIGPETSFKAATSIDAKGKAISPGFINMLSWGYNSLLEDGRGLSDLKQGLPLSFWRGNISWAKNRLRDG